jgi:flagellar biosynthetic protein FliO
MAWAFLAALALQETAAPESAPVPAPVAEPAAAPSSPAEPSRRLPAVESPASSRRVEERPEAGPSLGGFVLASILVVGLLGGSFWALRRFGGSSRLLGGGGSIRILGRRALGARQELVLVEVGRRAFLLGSTKDGLSTLGEFAQPDELAALRAEAPERKADSERSAFTESLRREMKGEPPAPSTGRAPEDRAFESIAQELAEIRRTVHAWKA